MTNTSPRIFCAVDTNDSQQAIKIVQSVKDVCGIKLGLEYFNAHGVKGIKDLMKAVGNDVPLFLDLKYHDIPNTVAGAIRAVTYRLKPAYLNVHASGGLDMMKAAKEACPPETKLLAVTVLTSIDADVLDSIGQGGDTKAQVEKLAKLAKEAGCDGVVCSSHDIETIRAACGDYFITMVPGIRPEGTDADDQKRVMTPKQAVDNGATHLVIGRPITEASDPANTAQAIYDSIS